VNNERAFYKQNVIVCEMTTCVHSRVHYLSKMGNESDAKTKYLFSTRSYSLQNL